MIDKVQKIREEVERRMNCFKNERNTLLKASDNNLSLGARIAMCEEILSFIDSLQEEPVNSIWHDSNEEQPNYASTVAIWNPKYKNGEIISRCIEVYSDRIWAYIDDLLKM